jgi:hypothetical protein
VKFGEVHLFPFFCGKRYFAAAFQHLFWGDDPMMGKLDSQKNDPQKDEKNTPNPFVKKTGFRLLGVLCCFAFKLCLSAFKSQ